jgi:hypothetical protein
MSQFDTAAQIFPVQEIRTAVRKAASLSPRPHPQPCENRKIDEADTRQATQPATNALDH